ncbi:MAG TPA: tyrosine-type recombinase/integrase [Bacteroidales bacterium]|nr:tyrosine-type recombinase/integrase [Bacteroidales bacterium]
MTTEHFLAYLQYEKRASGNTVKSYKADLEQFTSFCKSRFELDEISSAQTVMIREWLAELKSEGLDNRSINRKRSSLRAYYKYLQVHEALPTNPASSIPALKTKKRNALFVPEHDMARHNNLNSDDFISIRNHLIVEMLYQTGLRRAELRSLRTEDIDFNRLTVKITGKGNKQRLVPLTQNLADLIDHYFKIKDSRFPGNPFFMVTAAGKPISITSLHNAVKNELSLITTLEKRSPHVLRHTFATHLLNNGAPLIAVKELLGHNSIAATQIYTHNSIAQLKKIHQQAHPKG